MDELRGKYADEMEIGQTALYTKTVTEADLVLFAGLSGDTNPIHLDEEYAKSTRFKGRIAHGMLAAGFISTVLGTKLPGPGCIYLSQTLNFKAPVKIGDTARARATVLGLDKEKGRARLKTVVEVGNVVVVEGEAEVMVPRRPVP